MLKTVATETKYCDFCKQEGIMQRARFDGKTKNGPWAYMCFSHYAQHGVGLGLGKGQRLTKVEGEN